MPLPRCCNSTALVDGKQHTNARTRYNELGRSPHRKSSERSNPGIHGLDCRKVIYKLTRAETKLVYCRSTVQTATSS